MNIVFGYDYPSNPPRLIWMTPIWHPNFKMPHICNQGRTFAAGVTLDQVVLTVGEMVQYRNYNLRDPLNHEAAEWARGNAHLFPVDDRDLVDSRRRIKPHPAPAAIGMVPLVEIVDVLDGSEPPGGLVELVD
jgi:ubiquitin-protein ligase